MTAFPAWLVDERTREIPGTRTTATRRSDGVFEITAQRACQPFGVAIKDVDGEMFLGIMHDDCGVLPGAVIEVRMPKRQI